MAGIKRLSKVAKELNVATTTIVEFLSSKGIEVESNPNTKISAEYLDLLYEKFQSDKIVREYVEERKEEARKEKEVIRKERRGEVTEEPETDEKVPEVLIKSNIFKQPTTEAEEVKEKEEKIIEEVKKVDEVKPKPEEEPKVESPEKPVEEEKPVKQKPVEESVVEAVEKPKEQPKEEKLEEQEVKETIEAKAEKAVVEEEKKDEPAPEEQEEKDLKVVGKIDLEQFKKPKKKVEKEDIKAEEEKGEPIKEEPKEKQKEESEKPKKEPAKEETKEVKKEEEPKQKQEKKVSEEEKKKGEVKEAPVEEQPKAKEEEQGLKVVGKIDLEQFKKPDKKPKPVASTSDPSSIKSKRRRRIVKKDDKQGGTDKNDKGRRKDDVRKPRSRNDRRKEQKKPEVDQKEIKDQISQTLAKLTSKQGSGSKAKLKKQKRKEKEKELQAEQQDQKKVIEVLEFITANELANMLSVSVTEIITACMNLGLMVSINQRLDAETITIVADEFGYEVVFKQESTDEPTLEEEDNEDRLVERAPVVTIMGHVDHGKTSLLDYIRKSKIMAGEAGGITQHIGAYEVFLEDGRKIAFLDTPGHEAFTSMRARGAKVTDVAIIVVAADDSVMPQTKEAISHAQAAGVPIVFALNKVDKDGANPDRIKEQLADMNILVEDWGGKYQSQEISAKSGLNVDNLLEKVLLESELLELKADPEKRAVGTVIEASLDKGKGITTTVLIQKGTLRIGDPMLAGAYYGKVKAMVNELGKKLEKVGPSTPVEVLGFDGAPTAGDIFYVTENDHLAKDVATKRKRLLREQGIRATKHVTLDEIGRRIALGNFKELNIVIKGDVDGSVEALSDSFQKLSTDEIQVNVIHKGVGQISETDVMLAAASDAVIIGFQVRPSLNARKLAESEEIDIRSYSVIYDAIEELKLAMEGMLEPDEEEKIVCNVEVRTVFKITKVGTIAGCYVQDGRITRNTKVRILREGVIIYTGDLASLKRFKDDVKEVNAGYECGIGIQNFNDLKVGDIIEGFKIEQVKRKL
jgi:translation initiation factor IF-2